MPKSKDKRERKFEIWQIEFGGKRYIFAGDKPKLKKIKGLSNGSYISYMIIDEYANI